MCANWFAFILVRHNCVFDIKVVSYQFTMSPSGTVGAPNVEVFDNEKQIVFENNQVAEEMLMTTKQKCSICKIGDLKPEGTPTPMIVYGRNGTKVHPHQYTRCRFRAGTGNMKVACRASHSLGYKTYQGMRIYEDDALQNQILVVSGQSAFHIDYLVEVVGQVSISSGTFEGIAKQYNRFHQAKLPFDVMDRQVDKFVTDRDILMNGYIFGHKGLQKKG